MSEKAPVAVGEQFVSLRNGRTVTVEQVAVFEHTWCAKVETRPGFAKWITCSKDGIKGYRRKQ